MILQTIRKGTKEDRHRTLERLSFTRDFTAWSDKRLPLI